MASLAKRKYSSRLGGFTLIELSIATALIAIVAVSAYSAFRQGMMIHRRIEHELGPKHELRMLNQQLNQDLRSAMTFAPIPFEGEGDEISFPALFFRFGKNYTGNVIYEVRYRFSDQWLTRTERVVRKEFKDSAAAREEKLIRCQSFMFQFAYQDTSGNLVWKNIWSKKPYWGIPRAVRIVFKGEATQGKENSFDVMIPQGFLGTV